MKARRVKIRPVIDTPLKHPRTGRGAAVLRVERFESARPVAVAERRYVLVVASERATSACTVEHARAWIDAGASYVCIWGPAAAAIEEDFDYASFLPELGEPLPFTLMTTSHANEPLEEALWFAFYCAIPPDDLAEELNVVIVVVDSVALEEACRTWIQENIE